MLAEKQAMALESEVVPANGWSPAVVVTKLATMEPLGEAPWPLVGISFRRWGASPQRSSPAPEVTALKVWRSIVFPSHAISHHSLAPASLRRKEMVHSDRQSSEFPGVHILH
jgi:hypothetical protein